jgi:hypothetical protein
MTASFSARDAAGLRDRLTGRLVLPGEEEYDAARRVWNLSHDQGRRNSGGRCWRVRRAAGDSRGAGCLEKLRISVGARFP